MSRRVFGTKSATDVPKYRCSKRSRRTSPFVQQPLCYSVAGWFEQGTADAQSSSRFLREVMAHFILDGIS